MIEPFVRGFLRASLVWLGLGVVLGLLMAVSPGPLLAMRPAHAHMNLLGFVAMMIFGVAYHVIPRFTGNPLHSRRLPVVHFWLANGGLALMVAGWAGRILPLPGAGAMLGLGAVLSAAGSSLFIYTIWRTLDPSGAPAAGGDRPIPPTAPQQTLVALRPHRGC